MQLVNLQISQVWSQSAANLRVLSIQDLEVYKSWVSTRQGGFFWTCPVPSRIVPASLLSCTMAYNGHLIASSGHEGNPDSRHDESLRVASKIAT